MRGLRAISSGRLAAAFEQVLCLRLYRETSVELSDGCGALFSSNGLCSGGSGIGNGGDKAGAIIEALMTPREVVCGQGSHLSTDGLVLCPSWENLSNLDGFDFSSFRRLLL